MHPAIDKDLLISTPNYGKPVVFAPNKREECLRLKKEAKQYYYPMMALKHLSALSSGLMGKNNVFIPNIKNFKTNSFQEVVVFVPGIKATVEHRATGHLVVTELEFSNGYDSIAKRDGERPGVYRVAGTGDGFKASYKTNGRITPEANRNVAIADTSYSSLSMAVSAVGSELESICNSDTVAKGEFDLVYSPVGSKLGGLTKYSPDIHTESYAFAGLLADAMEKSKSHSGVVWASQGSGSVVLTQALQALVAKGASFQGKKHVVKMHRATTDPVPTLQAAFKLGMIPDKKVGNGNGDLVPSAHALLINASRARDPDDYYTWSDYRNDLSGGALAALSAAGAISYTATAAVSLPFLAQVGAVSGTVGAIHLGAKVLRNRLRG
ncbi:hypothetical protein [Saccharophagus degradans]|uniref:Uncharacterized protein n=1 Tax=Saccharophagus degradans TaxID=86304 RepID=A0AAW7X796_9GAMM|nr:hypothetical protein [Saccharophagus degradans]MDO6423449.1 hypothetical protein [Saccharophagus degradans]MDO6606854.1 hypothetical protein [Saccharophagus degradans]